MSSSSTYNPQLTGYGTVAISDEAELADQPFSEKNESWVQANLILPGKLVTEQAENENENDIDILQGEVTGTGTGTKRGSPSGGGSNGDSSSLSQPIYRDPAFAFLFIAQLAVMVFLSLFYGSSLSLNDDMVNQDSSTSGDNDNNDNDANNYPIVTLMIISIVTSYILTYTCTAIIIPRFSTLTVTVSLYTSVIINICFMIVLIITVPNFFVILLGIGLILYSIYYVRIMTLFIPFAATSLKLASLSISANTGIYFISFVSGLIGLVYLAFWSYTAAGLGVFDTPDDTTSTTTSTTDDYYYDDIDPTVGIELFLLLLSLYWTMIVISNIVQTTTAGVTGTWCFDKKNASSTCSSAVSQSLVRSCTYSFGSICFGSLLNAIVTTVRIVSQMAYNNAQDSNNDGAALLYCCLTCILSLLEDIIEYFNEWAFVFVGIWGLDYLESGKRVLELFHARGVTAILSNGLANYVLVNVVLFSSLLSGFCGFIVGNDAVSFWICFVFGLIISTMMTTIVQTAVKAIIVCYSDHPHRLYENHPEATIELTNAIQLIVPELPLPVFRNDMTV